MTRCRQVLALPTPGLLAGADQFVGTEETNLLRPLTGPG
jgi:hypothetical protein